MKRLLIMFLTIIMTVSLIPVGSLGNTVEAAGTAGNNFIFPNEQYNENSPRITNTNQVTVTGSLNGVIDSSISYSVYQLVTNNGVKTIANSNKGVIANVATSGLSVTISNISLYPGLNKITFQGLKGSAKVEDSIYIEYRNGPTLYDLKANLDGEPVSLDGTEAAILMATKGSSSYGKKTASTSITGFAPNADKVTVTANSKSWTYSVSSYNDYKFTASPVVLNKGKNLVTITVISGGQTLETTKEITFYNGEVTFYDLVAVSGAATSADLANYPDFSVTSPGTMEVNGKVIIPKGDALTTNIINYSLTGGIAQSGVITILSEVVTTDYVSISFRIANIPITAASIAKTVQLSLSANSVTAIGGFGFTLRDANAPYIYKVNYLPGYSEGMTANQVNSLTGSGLTNANVFSLPIAVEVLVVNANAAALTNLGSVKIVDSSGTATTGVLTNLATSSVVENVNGVQQTMTRYIMKLSQLPTSGQQTLSFTVDGVSETVVPITMLYGPTVTFNSLYDGMVIEKDLSDASAYVDVLKALDNYSGKILNVPSDATISYTGTNQTVFLYINNTLVKLVPGGANNEFTIASGADAFASMNAGLNTIKFEFKGNGTTRISTTFSINLVPTNVPLIPAANTLGIFPFSITDGKIPTKKDAKFEYSESSSVYLTKEKMMNIYGTFDFIDLGASKSAADGKLSSVTKDNYILKITGTSLADDGITWNMGDEFFSLDGLDKFNDGANLKDNLKVYYDYNLESFAFILSNQDVPTDGSPVVYTFTVYNSGVGGPSSTYRLEVTPITEAYTIVRPMKEKRIVNQNFVEVVVYSKNATSVTIGKQTATKIAYDENKDGVAEYDPAFQAIFKDLKANKDTKIDITININGETMKDSITVRYVPTNIPGAEYLETMKTSHKIFDGNVTLKFASGTSLTRRDVDVADQFKNQVFSNHDILFAIANGTDGVVDRHEFEEIPANYDIKVDSGEQYVTNEFPTQYTKTSPLFWIDAGIADDIQTAAEYDPITVGLEPYATNSEFYNRNELNELVPSKTGSLTLTYNGNVTEDAGRVVTVFRFDQELRQWENIGGVVDAKKNTITVPFNRFGYYMVAKLTYSYADIIAHPTALNYMETILAKGVMNAFDTSNEFGANRNISRGEFARAIVKGLEMPLNYQGKVSFIDINTNMDLVNLTDLYDFRYIETAARAGIVRGTQPQVFSASDPIFRQDAAVMIARALELKLETDRTKITKELQKYFKDYSSIDYYAQASVLAIAKKGFISGSPLDPNDLKKGYNFNPVARMLRGDTTKILALILADQKKLPKM